MTHNKNKRAQSDWIMCFLIVQGSWISEISILKSRTSVLPRYNLKLFQAVFILYKQSDCCKLPLKK